MSHQCYSNAPWIQMSALSLSVFIYILRSPCVLSFVRVPLCMCRIHINVLMLTKVYSMDPAHRKCFHFAYIFTPKHMLQFFLWFYFHLNYLLSNSIRFLTKMYGLLCSIPFFTARSSTSFLPSYLPLPVSMLISHCTYLFMVSRIICTSI